MSQNIYALITLFALLLTTFTLSFMIGKIKKNPINQSFFLICISIEIWILMEFLLMSNLIPYNYYFYLFKLRSIGWIFIGALILNFCLILLNIKLNYILYFSFIIGFIFLIFNFTTSFVFNGIKILSWGPFEIIGDLFLPLILLVIWLPTIIASIIILKKVSHEKISLIKKPLIILIIIFNIGILIGSITNYIFPRILGEGYVNAAAPISSFLFFLFYFIAQRYKLFSFDIYDLTYHLFNSQNSIIVVNSENIITTVNHEFEVIFNKKEQDVKNKNINTILPDYQNFENNLNNEIKMIIDNKERIFTIYQSILHYKKYEIGKIIFLKDITDLKIAKEEVKIKSEFLAIISHELKTPLTGILGFSELLINDNLISDSQKNFAERINRLGKKLLAIINDILDLSVLELREINISIEEIELKPLLDEIYQIFKNDIDRKGLNFVINCINVKKINSDPLRLRQIIFNLLSNAIKFTDNGEIILTIIYDNGEYIFSVEDTGIGIKENQKEIIFEMFYQGWKPEIRKYGGTGIGLTICRKLVERLNGKIWFESTLNKGTKFYFSIPGITFSK